MPLSNDLISQFVKITKDETKAKPETSTYGTVVGELDGRATLRLDGSDLITPASKTADVRPGDRVTVMIKNHTAVITGNLSSPAARIADLMKAGVDIATFEAMLAGTATIAQLEAVEARVDDLDAKTLTADQIDAVEAVIDILDAGVATIKDLSVVEARVDVLEADMLTVENANLKYAKISDLDATNADIYRLSGSLAEFQTATANNFTSVNATIENLKTEYANIDFSNIGEAAIKKFYSTSGIIKNLTVADGTYTGELVGVTITGDLIKANTILADRLVTKGSDGLYYKLNTDGIKVEAEQTNQNSLDGSVILAKSITATKISVSDLVAFGATIGGFHITDNALYSGVKTAVGNTTRGIYLDNDGQMAFGDADRFVKYYKDGSAYKLSLAADDISLSGNSLSTAMGNLANGLQSATTSIMQLSNEINVNVTETTNLGTRMTTFEQTASGITARLNTVESYDISGRNLIANTACLTTSNCKIQSSTGSLTRTAEGLKLVCGSDTARNGFILPLVADGCLINGQKYTLSFEYRTNLTASGTIYSLQRTSPNVSVSNGGALIASETEWQTFRITFSSDNINVRVCHAILIPYVNGIGNWIEIRDRTLKLEIGTVATNWCSAHEDASFAAKTATNYLGFSSSGLVVGDMTASTLGKNVLIDSEAVKVRTGSAVNAVFGADIIELAKDNESATISMLKGAFKIYYDADNSDGGFGVYGMTSSGKERLAFQPVNENDNLTLGWGGYADKANSTNLYGHKMYLTTNEDIILNPGSGKIQMDGNVVLTNGRNLFGTNTAGAMRSMALWSSDDQILFGYGSYANNEGSVYYSGNNIYVRSKNDIRLVTAHETVILQDGDGSATYNAFFKPVSNGKCTLGASANRWYAVYAANATIQTSDAREKENFISLDDRHSQLFDKLRPVQYNFINGNGRRCYGLIAQDVLSAMEELGIGEHELDLVHHDTWFDEESQTTRDSFGLAYANLIAMLIHEVQQLKRERRNNYA